MNIKIILMSVFCFVFFGCVHSNSKDDQLKIIEESIKRQDYETAYSALLPLAEEGDARSQFNLGLLYYNGSGKKNIPNYTQARQWFEKAAAQNHLRAQKLLALMYLRGESVLVDYEQGKFWLEKAAAQGDQQAQEMLQQLEIEMLPSSS